MLSKLKYMLHHILQKISFLHQQRDSKSAQFSWNFLHITVCYAMCPLKIWGYWTCEGQKTCYAKKKISTTDAQYFIFMCQRNKNIIQQNHSTIAEKCIRCFIWSIYYSPTNDESGILERWLQIWVQRSGKNYTIQWLSTVMFKTRRGSIIAWGFVFN